MEVCTTAGPGVACGFMTAAPTSPRSRWAAARGSGSRLAAPVDIGGGGAFGRERLQQFVKDRLLPHKYPRIVEFVADLPKTGTGKIDRQALRAGTSKRPG